MLVAALNIISGLIMLVQDKARAIAVLRTMGATRGAIMRIFLITGATIGVVGTACGLVLGLLVAHNVEPIRKGLSWLTGVNLFPSEFYFLSQLPSRVEPHDVSRSSRWRCSCRSRRRSIPRGARRGSIRSRRCAMNDGRRAPPRFAGRKSSAATGAARRRSKC